VGFERRKEEGRKIEEGSCNDHKTMGFEERLYEIENNFPETKKCYFCNTIKPDGMTTKPFFLLLALICLFGNSFNTLTGQGNPLPIGILLSQAA